MFLFSQPPPLRISLTSISSSSHCSKWITGVSSPRLSPLFLPVSESTEFGRSLPRRVASATASRIAFLIAIWFTPTGVCTTNVGMPVSWQIGPSSSAAISMLDRMMSSACEDCVPGVSVVGRDRHRGAHVGRKVGGGLGDQFQQAVVRNSIVMRPKFYSNGLNAAGSSTRPLPARPLHRKHRIRK